MGFFFFFKHKEERTIISKAEIRPHAASDPVLIFFLTSDTDRNCNISSYAEKKAFIWILTDHNRVSFICGNKLDMIQILVSVSVGRLDILWHSESSNIENADRCCRCPGFSSLHLKKNSSTLFYSSRPLWSVWWTRMSSFWQLTNFSITLQSSGST